ncbi:TadE/TadG family type IV pilus assembly protein [Massilia consociata]|uniref:TadE/TadG family type IV pilus assembly protein n=2 Tax=Massilia consociata TaxID=760117 RepID=A0ABV6FKG0_9BURK
MWATNPPLPRLARRRKQQGVAAVEFSLIAILYFTLFFGIIEVARAMYICNTLQEVTRRAAAFATNTDFSNDDAVQDVRERAIFRTSPGFLLFAEPVTDEHINIDYMRLRQSGGTLTMERIPESSLPADPAENHVNCTRNRYGDNCIRLVRVRVCQEGSGESCTPVPYRTLVSFVPLPFGLPRSVTIVNAETLGL